MIINLKVKTLDSQTHEFSIDNEITIRQFKDKIAEKTNIAAEQQRIIYCGRVLADEKQVKEYDVDGKVVHVAERPPPSARIPANSSSSSSTRRSERGETRGMRSSPLFRALDGMVVGAMAIPMNAGVQNQQTTINPLTSSSSSFCMNRITVARHMLDCANNIAAYLEDPERGLNNTSLDILAQGRWTMESTVVEVGITDIQQNQTHNIVEALQGAVSAALRQNVNTNVTVVQLPTVFGTNGADPTSEQSDTDNQSSNSGGDSTENMDDASTEHAVSIDDTESPIVIGPTVPLIDTAEPDDGGATSNSSQNSDQSPSRQRTGTRVLAEVIQQMRTVQARLNPFIDQYYELLQNEPTFGENDTTGRDNTQRLFDRVSEAFHYLSHAQHAISDLMLDVSQPSPRFLCCRPILVEQSGYVSSNNYMAYNPSSGSGPAIIPGTMPRHQLSRNTPQSSVNTPAASAAASAAPTSPATPTASTSTASEEPAVSTTTGNAATPAAASGATPTPTASLPTTPPWIGISAEQGNGSPPTQNLSDANELEVVLDLTPRRVFVPNHQMQVARLIQAVVNSAPIDADFHVQINAPSILSIGVPLNVSVRPQQTPSSTAAASTSSQTPASSTQQQQSTATTATPSNAASDSNTAASGDTNQARVTTATHPTTSTQTRSTARPQVQVANIPSAWNTRVIPANMLSSFDRFLPCNSHHIRDGETHDQGPSNSNGVNQQFTQPRLQTRILRRVRRPNSTPAAANTDSAAASTTPTRSRSPISRGGSSTSAIAGQLNIIANISRINRLRNQYLSFIGASMFNGAPINADGMPAAVEKAIHFLNDILIFLPQYDMHEYNSRASVEKLVRTSLPLIINLIEDPNDRLNFETRLSDSLKQLFTRLFVILFVCVGRMNAELYWTQITQMIMVAIRSHFQDEALTFLQSNIRSCNPDVENETTIDDVKQFLVLRDPSVTASNNEVTPMDTDSCSASGSASSSSNLETLIMPPGARDEILPLINVGSEPWYRNFPASWLPIMTRDIQRQTRQATQPPFSDTYISGMSAKRRKLIQSTKPPHDVKSLVAESVRRAIQTTGLQNPSSSNPTNSTDDIANAIATDSSVQASYCETLRSNIKERLKTDSDFTADKFPHTSTYFNKQN